MVAGSSHANSRGQLGGAPDDDRAVLRDIARTVRRFALQRAPEARAAEAEGRFPTDAWRALAELGVLGLATPDGGGASAMVAAFEALGEAGFPGPLVGTVIAARLIRGDDRERLSRGDLVVSVGAPPLFPWATVAERFIVIESGRAHSARVLGAVAAVATLGGEPWGSAAVELDADLGDASRASAYGDVALAAYLVGAGARLVAIAAEHARTRRQFGRAIGEFQAVAHPLASCAIRLRAARGLAAAGASALDRDDDEAIVLCGGARLSAERAALEAAYAAPQTLGALGVTLDGPVFPLARRIRQLASARDEQTRARAAVLAPFDRPENRT